MGNGAFALDDGGGVEEWIDWEMLIRGFGAYSPGGAYCWQWKLQIDRRRFDMQAARPKGKRMCRLSKTGNEHLHR